MGYHLSLPRKSVLIIPVALTFAFAYSASNLESDLWILKIVCKMEAASNMQLWFCGY